MDSLVLANKNRIRQNELTVTSSKSRSQNYLSKKLKAMIELAR
ncbi:hypothetical protein [Leptospira borgpetersenii]|nr:hypothetical protein [Leptospira borgpetersenii]